MKKALTIAIANIRKRKSAAVSMFVILMLLSALCTVGLSVIAGAKSDYEAGVERLHGLHSVFVMPQNVYLPSFEDIIQSDPYVKEYEIGEVLFDGRLRILYGGELEQRVMILNADEQRNISACGIIAADDTIPRVSAVYLPAFAQKLGFDIGSVFTIIYRNEPIDLSVAGFFASSEYAQQNSAALKFFVPAACYEELKRRMGSSVWIAVRFDDPHDSTAFNERFLSQIDVEIAFFADDSFVMDFDGTASNALTPTMIFASILLVFALVIVLISILVTRFQVAAGIEESLHTIGVLKASGYTGGQIIAGYITEYGIVTAPAALLGVLLAIPPFAVIRSALEGISGNTWTLGANVPAGLAAAALVVLLLLSMVLHSCRKLRALPPVDALRGEAVSGSRRRNLFPLHRGPGGIHTRLGLKSVSAFAGRYAMVAMVLASATFVTILIAALYQNFVIDRAALIRMIGIELADVDLTVARHTDAAALAAELASLPEVRKTSMLDWRTFQIDGVSVMGFVSDDFALLETMRTHDGRFPRYDNEVALPRLLADRLGKRLGDSVRVKANGVTLDYIISGFFSTANNGGQMGVLALDGYRRLDPGYRRNNIHVYLNEGVTFEAFSDIVKTNYGVVNVYRSAENDRFTAAKARAEEKIANYLTYYGIDSVAYAVIYRGEMILHGSSEAYRIEKITDFNAWAETQVAVYGDMVRLLTQVVTAISLCIIALILIMTVRQIVARRRRDLGILKSVGFSTRQLTLQLLISFIPCAVPGVALGCTVGALLVNPAVTAMFTGTGVYNADVHIYPPAVVLIGLLTLLFTFAVVAVSATRIRRITVYELLSE